ncbi:MULTISPECIES: GntR family transcriptional regulator [unclassified Planococcus (in: firmicutes)]|uniref:GntR family transcriptional regulator n=1 Tax=unclassified Planococcus (in: firmicutes) TaxID=2662419 RepID=UPI000C346216|nr:MULTISPECIES: GntR family transcriptional regulator [unclassified Planococcus (in: firmicutes)]AUD13200.1 GntR family transcriptional regulator [Planococcus sp. MB-3u-03]PKG45312.1 GntR family transcriptional regulator [Planococcus sp. Urea-trap-24]PKG89092.1 GntR family transcriptional regulator [Planococcus sp. Urea-3u-39]PKH39307.1 GntR family transcriptional regulator [Planococcus sp. MB-3u-09]
MVNSTDSAKPLFLQIRELIEDQIVNDQLKEGDQAPSTNQLVNFYKINHATVSKGITQLVDEGILFKKRGIGMFVAEGAKKTLVQQRKKAFVDNYVTGLVQEAEKLGITEQEIIELIKSTKGRDA